MVAICKEGEAVRLQFANSGECQLLKARGKALNPRVARSPIAGTLHAPFKEILLAETQM
jgi:hypothetical protein